MSESTHEFDRFVRAAHRRWVAWRVLERVGLGVLGACAIALPLIAALWFQDEPALKTVIVVLGSGALVGVIWGIVKRPTVLDTAIEADRQFDLHDLLGTAVTLSRCAYADAASRATVAALADARCRRLASSRMILNKLGARAWTGIGLATALVLTLSLMTTSPTPSIARTGERDPNTSLPDEQRTGSSSAILSRRTTDRDSVSPAASRRDARSHGSDDALRGTSSPTDPPTNASSSADGAGGAADQTDAPAHTSSRAIAPQHDHTTGTTPAAGEGIAGTSPTPSDDRAMTGVARSSTTARAVPPWRATTWSSDRARALHDVERGAVPDAYHDVVRAYFQED